MLYRGEVIGDGSASPRVDIAVDPLGARCFIGPAVAIAVARTTLICSHLSITGHDCVLLLSDATTRGQYHAALCLHADGTTLISQGRNGAVSVIAMAERGSLFHGGPCMYMQKLAVGPAVDPRSVSLDFPMQKTLPLSLAR